MKNHAPAYLTLALAVVLLPWFPANPLSAQGVPTMREINERCGPKYGYNDWVKQTKCVLAAIPIYDDDFMKSNPNIDTYKSVAQTIIDDVENKSVSLDDARKTFQQTYHEALVREQQKAADDLEDEKTERRRIADIAEHRKRLNDNIDDAASRDIQLIELVKKLVRLEMINPDKVEFDQLKVNRAVQLPYAIICGLVSGTTKSAASAGRGDSGFKKFIVDINEEAVLISDPFDISPQASMRQRTFADKFSDYCDAFGIHIRNPQVAPTNRRAATVEAAINGEKLSSKFDLKGIMLGGHATPQQIEQSFDTQKNNINLTSVFKVKCGLGVNNSQVCKGLTTVADVLGQLNLVIDARGMVQRIGFTFPPSEFAQVKDALSTKFGATQGHKHVTDQNRFGATFDDEILLWEDGNKNQVLLKLYAGDIEHSMLSLTTKIERDNLANSTRGHSNDL